MNVPTSMPIVLYYTRCKLFVILIGKYCLINKIPFASLLRNMLCVNKGLQSTVMWQCHKAMNKRFTLEHNNNNMTVWMFQASGIILHTLQIVCYFNLKILFIKNNIRYVICVYKHSTVTHQCMNERFISEWTIHFGTKRYILQIRRGNKNDEFLNITKN